MEYVQVFINFILLWIFQNFNCGFENGVQAKKNEVLPVGSFFGSWERRHIYQVKDTDVKNNLQGDSIEYDKAEFPEFRRRRKKKQKVVKNKDTPVAQNSVKISEKKKKLKKKKKKAKNNRRFVKTTLKEMDRDSKMSDSKDSENKGKPVDIIVHIKMND